MKEPKIKEQTTTGRFANVFSIENPVMDKLASFGCVLLVGILFLLTSLPIFTIGASLSASYAVLWKLVQGGDNQDVLRTYFRAFRRECRQATALLALAAAAGAVLVCDLYFAILLFHSVAGLLMLCLFIALSTIYLLGLFFLFPLQAHYSGTLTQHIRNAYGIGLRSFFAALLMLLLRAGVFVTVFFYYHAIPPLTFALVLGGHGFLFYADIVLVSRVLRRLGLPVQEEG